MICTVNAKCLFDASNVYKNQLDFPCSSNWANATASWIDPWPWRYRREKVPKCPLLSENIRVRNPSFRVKPPKIVFRVKSPSRQKRPKRRDCTKCLKASQPQSDDRCSRLSRFPDITPMLSKKAAVKCSVVSLGLKDGKSCVTSNMIC